MEYYSRMKDIGEKVRKNRHTIICACFIRVMGASENALPVVIYVFSLLLTRKPLTIWARLN
jgi:hypothetical protein